MVQNYVINGQVDLDHQSNKFSIMFSNNWGGGGLQFKVEVIIKFFANLTLCWKYLVYSITIRPKQVNEYSKGQEELP